VGKNFLGTFVGSGEPRKSISIFYFKYKKLRAKMRRYKIKN
jgi:hypothetical protein